MTVIVNTTLLPTAGEATFTVLVSARSACCVMAVLAVPVLFVGTVSISLTVVTVAELTSGLAPVYGEFTVTLIVRLVDAPLASAPSVQVTVPAANAQPGLALTNVTPAGSVSVTCAPLLAAGPLLVIVSVHASGLPGTTLAGALLVSARSAACRDVVECVVELLAACVSGSVAVTLAELNVVPDVPLAIDSARMS